MYGATSEDQESNFIARQPSARGQPVRPYVKQSARAYRPQQSDAARQSDESSHLQEEKTESTRIPSTVYCLAACAALNSCNLGYDLGINTDAGPVLRIDLGLSEKQYEFFNGVLPLCSAVGCLFISTISDRYGRRATFIAANLTLFFGVFLVSLSQSYTMLLIGRAITGFGIGIGLAIDPMYIAEMAPPSHRGWLVSWSEIAITFGVFAGSGIGWSFRAFGAPHNWRFMFAIGLIIPVLMLTFVATIMLESPRWLLMKERNAEAEEVIARLAQDEDDVGRLKQEIQISLVDEANTYNANSWADVLCPSGPLKLMMTVGVLSGIAQQVAGIEPILFYNQFIFASAGETNLDNMALYPIIFNAAKVCATVGVGPLLDKHGRRPMMVISFSGMCVSSAVLTLLFSWHTAPVWMIVATMTMWFFFFGVGAGPGCWLLTGELFSTTVRAKGVSITAMTNRLVASGYLFTSLSFIKQFGLSAAFGFLTTATALYIVFFYMILPETKGVTLEAITESFTHTTLVSKSQLPPGSPAAHGSDAEANEEEVKNDAEKG